jgi:hypothetical protein
MIHNMFYRQLGALKETEVLKLTVKSKEILWQDESGQVRLVPLPSSK